MVTFILLRHGLSLTNNTKRYTGQTDVPLHEQGVLQAKTACEYIRTHFHVDCIYSSDFSRAINTAKPLAETLGLEIQTTPKLREVDVGKWVNHTLKEVEALYPESFKSFETDYYSAQYEGGESNYQLTERAMNALQEIEKKHDGKMVLIATHGGVIRAVCARLLNLPRNEITRGNPPIVPNASITIVEYENGVGKILTYGFAEYFEKATNAEQIV